MEKQVSSPQEEEAYRPDRSMKWRTYKIFNMFPFWFPLLAFLMGILAFLLARLVGLFSS